MNESTTIDEPQITLFHPSLAADHVPTPENTCRRCKYTNVVTLPILITYPGTWASLHCCDKCEAQIKTVLDTAMKELGLGEA